MLTRNMEGGGCLNADGLTAESSSIATPESRGLNLRPTVPLGAANTSCGGLTSSNMGGPAGENADGGGVIAVEMVEMLEFEVLNSGR